MPSYVTLIKDDNGVGKRKFTQDFKDRYAALQKAAVDFKSEKAGVPVIKPKKARNRADDGTKCYLNTECAWSYGSYLPLWGAQECGCYDALGHWHKCKPEMCE